MRLLSMLALVLLLGWGIAQESLEYTPDPDAMVRQKLELWQDLKFGLLMHWGPYSQWGVVESWSICSEDEDWCRRNLDNYVEYKKNYEELYKTFNPIQFNPAKWAKSAREAGMKYVVFTTKHHDGFCMWDTKQTDYKVTSKDCPFSRDSRADITKEVFSAFRREGFWIGAYFSKPDWHSPFYWWPNFATPDRNVNYDPGLYPDRWRQFVQFTHSQVDELLSNYGRIDILWLDGGWVKRIDLKESSEPPSISGFRVVRLRNQDIDMPGLVRRARERQPGLIVVDRAVPGPYQNYLTPENSVPERMIPYPWESCIIMGGGWSFVPGARMKPTRELLHLLVDIVCKGGNLLLNIGPGPDGTWYEEAYQRLEEMGRWLKMNGEAIYGTRPIVPYRQGKVCLTRGSKGRIYAIYLADEGEKMPESIAIPLSPSNRIKVRMLGKGSNLPWRKDGDTIRVSIPIEFRRSPPCPHAWTFCLQEKRP